MEVSWSIASFMHYIAHTTDLLLGDCTVEDIVIPPLPCLTVHLLTSPESRIGPFHITSTKIAGELLSCSCCAIRQQVLEVPWSIGIKLHAPQTYCWVNEYCYTSLDQLPFDLSRKSPIQ